MDSCQFLISAAGSGFWNVSACQSHHSQAQAGARGPWLPTPPYHSVESGMLVERAEVEGHGQVGTCLHCLCFWKLLLRCSHHRQWQGSCPQGLVTDQGRKARMEDPHLPRVCAVSLVPSSQLTSKDGRGEEASNSQQHRLCTQLACVRECPCVCMFTHMCIHMKYVCGCMCLSVYPCVYMCACLLIYMCECMNAYVWMSMCVLCTYVGMHGVCV